VFTKMSFYRLLLATLHVSMVGGVYSVDVSVLGCPKELVLTGIILGQSEIFVYFALEHLMTHIRHGQIPRHNNIFLVTLLTSTSIASIVLTVYLISVSLFRRPVHEITAETAICLCTVTSHLLLKSLLTKEPPDIRSQEGSTT